MRVAYCSDLHLEGRYWEVINDIGADALIVAGDTCPLINAGIWEEFLEGCSLHFKATYIVLGNHEFYGTSLKRGFTDFYTRVKIPHNVFFLNDRAWVFDLNDGTEFASIFGGILWTDFDKGNEESIEIVRDVLADSRRISDWDGGTLMKHHEETLFQISKFRKRNLDFKVVVTHHAPSSLSTDPVFKNSKVNSGFSSDIDPSYFEGVDYWIYGHTHYKTEFEIGKTKVLTNPRGYRGENPNFKLEYFEV